VETLLELRWWTFPPPAWVTGVGVGLLVWLGAGAALVARLVLAHPRTGVALPVWALAVGAPPALVAGVLAEGTLPLDFRLLAGGEAALVLVVAFGLVSAWDTSRGPARAMGLALAALPWAVLGYLLAFARLPEAADRLRDGPVAGSLAPVGLLLLVGLSSAALARGLRRRTALGLAGAVALTVMLTGPGYLLIRVALWSLRSEAAPAPAAAPVFAAVAATQTAAVAALVLGHLLGCRIGHLLGEDLRAPSPAVLAERTPASAYGLAAVVYASLVVYGSLVPLEFRPMALDEAFARFAEIPYLELGLANRADLVANLVLFVPLGFALAGALASWRPAGPRAGGPPPETTAGSPGPSASPKANGAGADGLGEARPARPSSWRDWPAAAPAVAVGAALAVALEFVQQFFPPRTVSLNDLAAETVGAAVGAGVWLAAGRRLTAWAQAVHATATRGRAGAAQTAAAVLSAYAVALVLFQLFPFDLVLSAEEMAARLASGRVEWPPLADWSRLPVPVALAKALALVPIGYWAVLKFRGPGRASLAAGGRTGEVPPGDDSRPRRRGMAVAALVGAALVGAAYAAGVEMLQVFVHSRYAGATDVLLGTAGAVAGGWFASRFGPVGDRPPAMGWPWRVLAWVGRLALLGGLAAVTVWAKWSPMTPVIPPDGVLASLVQHVRVPFYYQYYNSEFEALGQVLRDTAVPAALAMLLVSLLPRRTPWRRGLGGAAAGLFGAGVELGQVFFPPHVPDATTALLAVGGAAIGAWLYEPLVRTFLRPGAGNTEAQA